MSYPHPKQVQQELWRKLSPPRSQPTYKPQAHQQVPRQPEIKYTFGAKQSQQARHRSPSTTDLNQVNKINSQLNQFQLQNSRLMEQNKVLTSNYNRLVDQNRDYRSEIQFFRTQFNKLRSHINSTESIRQEVIKINKLLGEQKAKTQKYINQNNKLVHQIKAVKALLDSERLILTNVQKQKNQIKRQLQIQRKQKQQKTLIINQSRIMFEDEIRVLESVKGLEQNLKQLDKQIEIHKKQIEVAKNLSNKSLISENEFEVIKKLEAELQSLKREQSRQEINVGVGALQVRDSEPIIRNLKIIFEEQKSMLMKELHEKDIKLQELTNRLESLTLGDDSQQDIQNI